MIHTGLFLIIYIGGMLQSILKHPALIFCVYQCVYFFYPQERWWGAYLPDFSYSFVVACLLLTLTSVVGFSRQQELNTLKNPIIKTLFIFLLCFAFAYTQAVFPESHLEQLEFFVKAFVIICCAYALLGSMTTLKWYLNGYIFGAFYLSFYTYQLGRNAGDRVIGIGVLDNLDSNFVAASLAPAIILALHFVFTEKNRLLQLYYALACVFISNALVLVNSRGAMLGAAIGGAFYLYSIYKSKNVIKHPKFKALGLVSVALAGGLFIADDSALERFNSIFEESAENVEVESGATRMHFWIAAIDMSEDFPLGLGFRGFNAYSGSYIPEEVNTGRSRNRSVHSSWFEALSEVGYIGFIVLLYLVYLSVKLSNSAKNYFKVINAPNYFLLVISIQGALITTLVSMSFISRMRGETFLWLLMFIAGLYEITNKRRQTDKA
jgi:hypothetical protein